MSGETNLNELIKSLSAELVDGLFVFASVPHDHKLEKTTPRMIFKEVEGTTYILLKSEAEALEIPMISESQLLEMVGLSHVKRRRVGEFSKGMQRRIGLAQAMINDPALLILDEPTSGLDPLGCREVKDLILNMKKRGKTVLVTSHLLSDVEDICDRVIILYGGKVRATGVDKRGGQQQATLQ